MEPAGVSDTVTISDQKSYTMIEILCGKNPTEIHDDLSEVCGEFTVDRSTVSPWANRFRGGCVSIDNDPKPGRPRTPTDERSVQLVADALAEDRCETYEERSRATGVPVTSVFRILINDLKTRKISARQVPQCLYRDRNSWTLQPC